MKIFVYFRWELLFVHFAPNQRLCSVRLSSQIWATWRRPQRLLVCRH